MERPGSGARIVSPFQLLWLYAAETMTVAALVAIQSDLEIEKSASLVSSDRAIFTSAIAELDGLMVARLAKKLASEPDAGP